jgi:3-dehydroquinate synthase
MIEFTDYQKSKVVVGETFKNLISYVPDQKRENLIILTDSNVGAIYGKKFPKVPVIHIGTGESIKTQKTVDEIIDQLLDIGADRHTYLVGIGGGIVCDITGYVASIFMRGISFGYVSTSMLSQIDASIGGKTGVNHKGFKNLVGTFNQPDFVICDLEMLKTLPKTEINNGLAEAIKHAFIADAGYYRFINENSKDILSLRREVLEKLVARSIEIKTAVVNRDEKEKGERKKLNFGHTYGHAIESLSHLPHGQAVAVGMVKAAELSLKVGFCRQLLIDELKQTLQKFGLPIQTNLSDETLVHAIQKDKKRRNNSVDFVFIKEIGDVEIKSVPLVDLRTRSQE